METRTNTGGFGVDVGFGKLGLGYHHAFMAVADSTGFSNTSQPILIQVNPDPTATVSATETTLDVGQNTTDLFDQILVPAGSILLWSSTVTYFCIGSPA